MVFSMDRDAPPPSNSSYGAMRAMTPRTRAVAFRSHCEARMRERTRPPVRYSPDRVPPPRPVEAWSSGGLHHRRDSEVVQIM